jgi:hypothetical protein
MVVWNINSAGERKFAADERAGLDLRMTKESANQVALVQSVLKKLPVCQSPIRPVVL